MLFLIRMALLLWLIVGVTLCGIVFCLLTLWSKNRVYYISRVFAQVGPLFGLSVEVRVAALAKAVPQAVYVANHQNNFDLFTLAKIVPKGVVTVGKTSLRWIPFFGALYWASGNILINRDNRQQAIATIEQVVASMKKTGLSIWMFPEGTRSRGRGWLPFKRGAFHAALQAGVPIIPVVCSSTHGQVNLNRWDNGKVLVEMLPPIDTAGLLEIDVVALMKQCEQQMHDTQQRLDNELGKRTLA
ncbi:1-acylglycerol-3-phosphate O-acyltransferase [Marinomonas sp. M1K-6]|uniref:1-acyl-sn-glycerol-3-phosphate acyltransferase n=1 Tax=Marinomonas profundi TaxID=2726122 RepID=A0A847QZP0_9GAMM|nr:1-acylglycerol-3-phosphate O-acyltransferase [Marinomonas profundi]NLQ18869.1 1-acylglycerol-3-phosphate O-acyltransferase [Marinomonas profundi]UDV01796.1 1-acylglycerol-3-phosphate O-acyltransferase [Marinomonas profundi]